MGKQNRREEHHISNTDYKELIVDMVSNISDKWVLEQIYRCIKNMIKED